MSHPGRPGSFVVVLILMAAHVQAQPIADSRRLEVSAGIEWLGRASFGSRDANETTSTGAAYRLFSTASELTAASGVAARITLPLLIRRIELEAAGSYARPDVATRVTSDAETSNAPVDAIAHASQFTIGGAALWYPHPALLGPRAALFVRAGAALERRLEGDSRRVVDGAAIEAGGGLKYLFVSRPAGWWRALGARGDIVARVRGAALALDGRAHISPALAASLYVRF